jgi:hypothetical protein
MHCGYISRCNSRQERLTSKMALQMKTERACVLLETAILCTGQLYPWVLQLHVCKSVSTRTPQTNVTQRCSSAEHSNRSGSPEILLLLKR